ncbi:hypothetical protein [Shewanella scandinavica]|uniref:hypothetical protein n=1 Tax=Shewanella scandinavica TaxID=3063538 RepID=UPI00319B7D63
MNKLLEKIKELKGIYDISKFEWEIPENCPLTIPESENDSFKKNVYLKKNLKHLINGDKTLSTHYWVIQDWGGIRAFKKGEPNNQRIAKFLEEIKKGKLSKANFDAISSLSKVASFMNPEEYVIYDSRVIYGLNWLLFNFSNSNKLFPQPVGRSAALAKYDMQTIFRLSGKSYVYYSHKEAFHEYCRLIKELSSDKTAPYLLEMFIFAIAPTWVVQNIKETVSLEISNAHNRVAGGL